MPAVRRGRVRPYDPWCGRLELLFADELLRQRFAGLLVLLDSRESEGLPTLCLWLWSLPLVWHAWGLRFRGDLLSFWLVG